MPCLSTPCGLQPLVHTPCSQHIIIPPLRYFSLYPCGHTTLFGKAGIGVTARRAVVSLGWIHMGFSAWGNGISLKPQAGVQGDDCENVLSSPALPQAGNSPHYRIQSG